MKDLINNIYEEILSRNTYLDKFSVPQSDDFFQEIANRYKLILFNVPKLFKMLENAKMIFSFTIVEEDRSKKIRKVEGYVITKGDTIRKLIKHYEGIFLDHYAAEFTEKPSIDKAIQNIAPKVKDYNNTPLGNIARIFISLATFMDELEKNISQYSKSIQEKKLEEELEGCSPASFVAGEGGGIAAASSSPTARSKPKAKAGAWKEPVETSSGTSSGTNSGSGQPRKAKDSSQPEKAMEYGDIQSNKKALSIYGVDFYTRICFRDYQFSVIQKLIDEGSINKEKDLLTIKKYLKKERANADQDMKVQEFAQDINMLEKSINSRMKQIQDK
ncbi:MAG: hypothetical protein GY754_12435 [bacterium]|nr:hypothetical protein [bacterium]